LSGVSAEGENERSVLPEGWRWMRADEVGAIQLGRQRSPKHRSAEFPTKYLRAANITENGLDLSDVMEMEFKPSERVRYELRRGDIVLSEASGSSSQVGKPAIWNDELPLCCFQNTVIRLRPNAADSKYLFWLFTHFYRNGVFSRVAGGVGINHLSAAKFSRLELPIAPIDEQKRIVLELENQFTRLDAAANTLRHTGAKLKRYRAAVLKAACEGRLVPTEAELSSRGHRNAEFETGEDLVERISAMRREERGASAKYRVPIAPDVAELSSLPDGWSIASIDQLSGHITSGSRDWSQFYNRGTGTFILAQNVRPMRLDLGTRQSVAAPAGDAETERTRVYRNDVLVTIVGANTGDVCRVPTDLQDSFVCQSVALIRPVLPDSAKFIEVYLASEENGQAQWKRFIYGQGRPHLSFDQLRTTAIAVPPLAEQTRIVAEVERRLSVVEELEAVVNACLQRAGRLRQSILQKAFAGELV
jgi:type I restriction enzyme S subunit